jgi:MFS family permease
LRSRLRVFDKGVESERKREEGLASSATSERRTRIGVLAFAALMLGHSAQGLTFTAFTPALAAMAKTFNAAGDGAFLAQFMVTIASGGLILGAFASGWIVDRIGARRTLLAAIILYGVCGAGGLVLQNVTALLVSRAIVGFATACLVTAAVAEIAALFDGNARAKVIGASTGLGSATALVGLVLGGLLAQAGGWRLAFVQYPVFAVLGLGAVLFGLRGAARPAPAAASNPGGGALGRLWPMYLLSLVIMMVMFMGSTQFAFLLPQDGVRQPTTIALIMGLITLFAVGASFAYGAVEARLGARGALAFGLGCNALGLGLIGLVPNIAAAAVGAAFMGVYVGTVMPFTHHAVASLAPPHARARAIGLLNAFNFMGAFINPFLFNPLSARFGLHGLFLIVGCVMAVMAVGALLLRRRSDATLSPQTALH